MNEECAVDQDDAPVAIEALSHGQVAHDDGGSTDQQGVEGTNHRLIMQAGPLLSLNHKQSTAEAKGSQQGDAQPETVLQGLKHLVLTVYAAFFARGKALLSKSPAFESVNKSHGAMVVGWVRLSKKLKDE